MLNLIQITFSTVTKVLCFASSGESPSIRLVYSVEVSKKWGWVKTIGDLTQVDKSKAPGYKHPFSCLIANGLLLIQ